MGDGDALPPAGAEAQPWTAQEGEAARLVRLLTATVSIVSVDGDPLLGVPAFRSALAASAGALGSLADDDRELLVDALDRLAAIVADLHGPHV